MFRRLHWAFGRTFPGACVPLRPPQDARAGVVSVKEALKLALLSALSERLQAEPEVESLLRVTLSFSHGEDAAETVRSGWEQVGCFPEIQQTNELQSSAMTALRPPRLPPRRAS